MNHGANKEVAVRHSRAINEAKDGAVTRRFGNLIVSRTRLPFRTVALQFRTTFFCIHSYTSSIGPQTADKNCATGLVSRPDGTAIPNEVPCRDG